jgi:hypothetical protein
VTSRGRTVRRTRTAAVAGSRCVSSLGFDGVGAVAANSLVVQFTEPWLSGTFESDEGERLADFRSRPLEEGNRYAGPRVALEIVRDEAVVLRRDCVTEVPLHGYRRGWGN